MFEVGDAGCGIADDEEALALGFDQYRAVAGGVSGCGHHRHALERCEFAIEGFKATGFEQGVDAGAGEVVAGGGGRRRVGEVGGVDLAEVVGGVREGDRAVVVFDVPADVVAVEVGEQDRVDLGGLHAEGGDAVEQTGGAVMLAVEAVAIAGVDQDGAATSADEERAEVDRQCGAGIGGCDRGHPVGVGDAGEPIGGLLAADSVGQGGDAERAELELGAELGHVMLLRTRYSGLGHDTR